MAGGHAHAAPLTGVEGTREGLRAIKVSGVVLGLSAVLRLTVSATSGSVGLLAAGLDDLGDVLTTLGLLVAFMASRRAADRRYTFGYQRLEDLGGVLVVLVIWSSAVFAGYQAYRKLVGEHEVAQLGVAMAAALAGLAANGIVGIYKIRVGRRIGSQPLAADGRHALTDALASVAAFGGLLGVRAGAGVADPIAAFVVVLAIAAIGVDASRRVAARLLDAVDPHLIEDIERIIHATPGIVGHGRVQARWVGRSLYVSLTIAVDGKLTVAAAHDVSERLHHEILHEIGGVAQVDVHVDPWEVQGEQAHPETRTHS